VTVTYHISSKVGPFLTTRKLSLEVAPTTLVTRKFSIGSYFFTVSNRGLLFSHGILKMTPASTGRVDGPWTRPVNTGVVCTDLNSCMRLQLASGDGRNQGERESDSGVTAGEHAVGN